VKFVAPELRLLIEGLIARPAPERRKFAVMLEPVFLDQTVAHGRFYVARPSSPAQRLSVHVLKHDEFDAGPVPRLLIKPACSPMSFEAEVP
jgi:hypothetical protein